MRPVINYAYDFTFITKFSSLDDIYIVKAIYSYAELILADVDLFTELYEPIPLTSTEFDQDLPDIRGSDILKLVKASDEDVIIHIPDIFFENIPNANVAKYEDLAFAISLGVYTSADVVTSLVGELSDIVQAKTGISEGAVLYSKESKWMTSTDFEAIDQVRESNKTDTVNTYTKYQALLYENQQLRDLVTYYEDLVKAL